MVNGAHVGSRFPSESIERAHPGSIGLGTLRRDGFVSLEAAEETGYVLTRPFRLDGRALHLNVDVRPDGHARVIVCDPWLSLESYDQQGPADSSAGGPMKIDVNYDEDGHVTESFASQDISGNYFDVKVRWSDARWQAAVGKVCALRIELQNANLYSYWWE